MKQPIPLWGKIVRIECCIRDIGHNEMCDMLNFNRNHVSSVVNGNRYSESVIQAVSDLLGIADEFRPKNLNELLNSYSDFTLEGWKRPWEMTA